jgi:site-specific DNA-methyltransferase (cytosine-N4-specific)
VLIQGDARHIALKDRSVQMVCTSPPYWAQRDYRVAGQLGLEATRDEYVAAMVEVFREVRRVLKDDGTLWLVLGDSYSNAGSGHRDAERWPKQANNEHWPDRDIKKNSGAKSKDLLLMPFRVASALQDDGWYIRSDIVWSKKNPMPSSARDRPTSAHEYVFLLSKNETYYYDYKAIMEPAVVGGLRNKRDVWTIANEPTRGIHLAAFPKKLIEPCILAGSRPGDLVFDPFIGSGTVGVVAEQHGRRWVGLDLHPDHLAGIRRGMNERLRARFARFTHHEILEIFGCDEIAA